MLPSFLITFREVVEATAIVATILGVVSQLHLKKAIATVWYATGAASFVSIAFISLASLFGLQLQKLYVGKVEEITEGILMITSALLITWAVFFLHAFFSQQKGILLRKVKKTIEEKELKGLFFLVFTAVFREGFEIALFLGSIYLSTNPSDVAIGFIGGLLSGLMLSLFLFKTTERLPVQYAFHFSSILLILFAGGLIMRGIHEFAEVGFIPEILSFTLTIVPEKSTFIGGLIKALFGITQRMDLIQVSFYSLYILAMSRFVFKDFFPPPPFRFFTGKRTDNKKENGTK